LIPKSCVQLQYRNFHTNVNTFDKSLESIKKLVYSASVVGHRLLLMNEGRVEQIFTPLEVNEKPKVLFIAGFIISPSMKFIPVRLDQSGNQVIL